MSRSVNTRVWKYFTRNSNNLERIAMCNICHKYLSYKTTITNLKQHLRLKHNSAYDEFCSVIIADPGNYRNPDTTEQAAASSIEHTWKEEESNHSNSDLGSLWNHFEQLSRSRARCTMCKVVIDILDMQDHLRTKHPKVSSEEHDLDSGTEAQNNGEEETYTEIIYLDENFSQNKPKTYENPLKKRKSEVIYKSKPNRIDKTDNNDELDKFLTYISCLMKNMPKDVTDVLQMEIINLIMKEKIKLTQKPTESNQSMNITLNTPSTSTNNSIVVANDKLGSNTEVDNIVTSFKND